MGSLSPAAAPPRAGGKHANCRVRYSSAGSKYSPSPSVHCLPPYFTRRERERGSKQRCQAGNSPAKAWPASSSTCARHLRPRSVIAAAAADASTCALPRPRQRLMAHRQWLHPRWSHPQGRSAHSRAYPPLPSRLRPNDRRLGQARAPTQARHPWMTTRCLRPLRPLLRERMCTWEARMTRTRTSSAPAGPAITR